MIGAGTGPVTCLPVTGVGEVRHGDDLATVLGNATTLADGDVLVVTSKVVSKAEGRVVAGRREDALQGETDRVVAVRGATAVVRTRLGLVMAAAGIDATNTRAGTVVLLPEDPDASARALRESLAAPQGPNVAVVVTDTSGRAWRTGQTDIAIGAAGIEVLHDYRGRLDPQGNLLSVTTPAVADEIASAADLVKGKLSQTPAAVVRGLAHLVLPRGQHGPGGAALVRPEAEDLFGFGAREAVLQAVLADPSGLRGFGAAVTAEELVAVLSRVCSTSLECRHLHGDVEVRVVGPRESAGISPGPRLGGVESSLTTVAFAMGWVRVAGSVDASEGSLLLRFACATP